MVEEEELPCRKQSSVVAFLYWASVEWTEVTNVRSCGISVQEA